MTQSLAHRPGALTERRAQADYILIDGSGSMTSIWWDTLDAVEAYIQGLKAEQVDTFIDITVFDSTDREYIARQQSIHEWVPLRREPIGAHWGGTPLYDAIQLLGRRLRDEDPERAAIVIATDGGEAGSTFTTLEQAKAILNWMRAKDWQVIFIGANFDNSETARQLGIEPAKAIGVEKSNLAKATKALAYKRGRYGRTGEDMAYTEDERQQFGGYLPKY